MEEFHLPSGITGISTLRGCMSNPASVNFQTINFQTINFQIMYRVIFYKKKTDFRGNISMERISLDSGCTTLAEAFSFAVENGADPNKNILYKWIEQ